MGSIHYTLIGEATNQLPLYVIHTVPLDQSYFKKSLENVQVDFQIVLIDLPGHGKSENVEDEGLEFDSMAKSIDELRTELNHDQIIVLGHGIGGFVAQSYSIRYEDHLAGLILVNTSPNAKYREAMAWNIREKYSKVTIQALEEYRERTDDKSVRARFTQSLATYFDPPNHELAKMLMNNAERIATQSYVHLSRAVIPNVDYRSQIRSYDKPTLIIGCKNDVWPLEASQLLRNDLIQAKYREMETGHFPMIVEPEEFWSTISKFVLEI